MECMDNHTAGTPPSWGAPIWTVHSIFLRDGDKPWITKMYPLLKGYLEHWLVNRTDSDGYQICMCTWESGQDMMYRWGWNQSYGGDRSSRIIRAPEHQAAMSHAAGVMKSLAGLLGMGSKEESFWARVRDNHANLTKSLFNAKEGWFCDYNSKVGVWQSGCNDDGPAVDPAGAGKQSYQLAPLLFVRQVECLFRCFVFVFPLSFFLVLFFFFTKKIIGGPGLFAGGASSIVLCSRLLQGLICADLRAISVTSRLQRMPKPLGSRSSTMQIQSRFLKRWAIQTNLARTRLGA